MMADFIARIFVVVFIVIYVAVMLGLVGWSLRRWLGSIFKNSWPARIFHRVQHSNLSHHPRDVR